MLYRLRHYHDAWLLRATQRRLSELDVRLSPCDGGVTVLSMVSTTDVHMYLLAVTSFAARCPVGRVCVLDDGSLKPRDRAMIEQRIPFVEWLDIDAFRNVRLPRGGCWERLHAQVALARHDYVIQLDADTLSTAALDEVVAAVGEGRPFLLGTRQGHMIGSARAAAAWAKRELEAGDEHVQTLAETVLPTLDGTGRLRYVRGCAAFSGLPPSRIDLETLYTWSSRFAEVLGGRWTEWGTEQFMSCLLISNLEDSQVLPHPKYSTCPEAPGVDHAFVHFSGYCRYRAGTYRMLSRRLIAQLEQRRDAVIGSD
jgi:hypothetical protein